MFEVLVVEFTLVWKMTPLILGFCNKEMYFFLKRRSKTLECYKRLILLQGEKF